jgi:hypothetical protein
MGKGMPARNAAAAIAVVLLLLCLAMLWHRRAGPAGAGEASRPNGSAIGDVGKDRVLASDTSVATSAIDTGRVPSGDAAKSSADGDGRPKSACGDARRMEFSRLYAVHARPADADEAIDAALLLLQMRREADAASLLGTASVRWPRDPELAWFAWSQCEPESCDREARLQRLLAVDPDNAVSWLYAAQDAWRREDEAAIDIALARAARAPDYATNEGVLFLHGMALAREMLLPGQCVAVIQHEMASEMHRPADAGDVAVMEAENMENLVFPPAYSTRSACRASSAPPASPRRAACIAVLRRMAGADTQLERAVGVEGLLGLLPDLPRNDPLREVYRRQQWLMAIASRLSYSPGFFARMHAEGGWKTFVGEATEQGLWPPPADWLPDAPDARARVLGTPLQSGQRGGPAPE